MNTATIIVIFVGGLLLAAGLGVFGPLSFLHRKPKPLPEGYELRTATVEYSHFWWRAGVTARTESLFPLFHGVRIADGYDIDLMGYKKAIRHARRDIFEHFKNNVK